LFQDRKPNTVQSDKGTEFVNATVQQYLKRKGVEYHTTHNPDIKGAVIERFNRTLKTRMYKLFTTFNTYRYLDVLSDLVTSYNTSVHSTVCMAPADVSPANINTVCQRVNSLEARIPVSQV
jgi:transposase InsO family protein